MYYLPTTREMLGSLSPGEQAEIAALLAAPGEDETPADDAAT